VVGIYLDYKGPFFMRTVFPGFPPEAPQFFRSLARNNRREWFQPRKEIFEEKVKAPMRAMVEALNAELRKFAPAFVTDPEKAIYRIYRDTRFSKDKTPYKDHIAASFHRRTPVNHSDAGFYVAMSHKESAIGGGIYMPGPPELLAIRHHIDRHHQELRKILKARAVKDLFGDLHSEQLSRVPKGFAPDHPAADLLRFKRFVLYVELEPELATTPEFFTETVKRFRAMTPLLEFLTAPLSGKRKPIDARDLM
jgi:uncharacterized protein (TIGR02453 family)